MTSVDYMIVLLALLFGFILPFTVVLMRNVVKWQRQAYIEDLAKILQPHDRSESSDILPSLEFVKFKYFLDTDEPSRPKDVPMWSWIVSIFPFAVLTTMVFVTLFGVVVGIISEEMLRSGGSEIAGKLVMLLSKIENKLWFWILVVTFFSGYLFIVRSILRGIYNFDLSPLSFIAAAIHLLFGTATALVILYGGLVKGVGVGTLSGWEETVLGVAIVAAFAVGFIPELGLRTLIRRSGLSDFKRENVEVYRSFKATPVEIVDGIDSEVRVRLADYNIVSVQNLATANPIMLFVETPYGIYQVMDWVAQAQLCSSVGADALTKLWKLGIRTIFDLERVSSKDPTYSTPALRRAVGHILLPASQAPGSEAGHDAAPFSDDDMVADIQLRLNDPHVWRLRQIFARVCARLGSENRRFPLDVDGRLSRIETDVSCDATIRAVGQ